MAWEWVTNSARKAAELGAEYLQHSGLIDRLIKLPPDTAGAEIERALSSLDDRARAGFKMTLGALILKQQAISTPDGKAKLQRLLDLRTRIDPRAAGATATAPQAKSWNETIARARDRVTALVEKAGSIPRAEMFAALRRELDAHRPQIEAKGAATWNALSTRLNALAARAEAMGKDPEARAALAAFRDAMIAALAAHVAAQHPPQTSPAPTNPVTSARTALDAYARQPSLDIDELMALARILRDARRDAGELTDETLETLDGLDTAFAGASAIALDRRRAAVQRRTSIEFVNAVAGDEVVTAQSPPSHDDQVEALMAGAGALGALGLSSTDLLQNMIDAALREEREQGILTAARQKSWAHLSASLLNAARIKDASALADRCWELADQLITLTHDRPTTPATDLPALDDKRAKRLAQLEQLEPEFEQEVADGKMTPARAATYRAQVAEAQSVMRTSQKTEGDEVVFRSRLRELIDRQLESMEHIAPQPEGTRAHVLQRVTGQLQSLLLKELTKMTTTAGERETADALGVRVFEAQRIVENLTDDAGACELEVETLRRVAGEVSQFQRRHHLTLISPAWASPEARTEASGVFCACGSDLQRTLGVLVRERRLKLLPAGASGKDPAQDAWNRLRSAAVAIFDLREYEPIEAHGDLARAARAGAICYELGIAYCLGVPSIIVARADQRIPFDLDLTPVELTGEQSSDLVTLGDAIDEAFYGSQRTSAGDSVPATWEYFLQTCCRTALDEKQRQSVEEMKREAGADAILSARLIGHGLSLMKGTVPRLAYPILPGRYPDARPRCFIVMPFRDHVDAGYRLIVDACKKARVKDVRGDVTADQQILRSIWDELGRATYVTADLTDFNPNVCLELGIADTLGRSTILIGRPGTEKALFPSIAKRRVHVYTGEAASDGGVRDALARFFSNKPAPAPPAPAPQPFTPPKPPAPAPPPAQTIGGLWGGVLRNGDETMEMTIRISPAGRTMYCYRDTQGYREVELTREGQQIQFVPSGGGVITVRVLDLSKSARECGHLISWSFERAAYGYMDQQYLRIALQCELRGDKLAVAYAESGETYMSDLTMMLGGESTTRQFHGTLNRERE